jgi:hypothetical protein
MHDLDSFLSPIHRFEGDVSIPAILILARDPSTESSEEALAGSSASTPRTRAYKRKVHVDPNSAKKAKKMTGNPLGGIKITGPKQKAPILLLHWELGKGSRSSDPKGIIIINSFFYHLLLIHRLPCRVTQDIPLASPAKDSQLKSESPKVDKPLSPSTGKTLPKPPNPSGLEDTHVPIGVASNLTSPPAADSRRDATRQSPSPDPAMHQDASPISPKSFGLGAHG